MSPYEARRWCELESHWANGRVDGELGARAAIPAAGAGDGRTPDQPLR
jgi:hypothetical protein